MSDHPFDKFSAHARRALFCAQQEAEDAGVDHIGTEHLMLGLFRVGAGSGYRALLALGVDELKVRADIDRAHTGGRPPAGPRPTKGVQQAIELAFRESTNRGTATVRSGHLLAGIALVGDGTAAKLLKQHWVEAPQVIAAVERELLWP